MFNEWFYKALLCRFSKNVDKLLKVDSVRNVLLDLAYLSIDLDINIKHNINILFYRVIYMIIL